MTDAYPNELPDYEDRDPCSYNCSGISLRVFCRVDVLQLRGNTQH